MPNTELVRTISASALETRGDVAMGRQFVAQRPDWSDGTISDHDARFLSGLAHFANVRNVVEIGVASGWSSAVLLKALGALDGNRKVTGIDLSPHYYLDRAIPTGRAVDELVPERLQDYRLLTGRLAFDVMDEVGPVDFAFIDGHHMHPWATLDMLSLLPHISRERWVAMHDLNLCTFERHKHMNRGPFYLFYMWPDRKLHSTQNPTMIGVVLMEREPKDYLPLLLEILYTPWEVDVDASALDRLVGYIGRHFGTSWGERFTKAFTDSRARFGTA
jgi:predicted O-methyltransferase YrrM